MDNESVNGESYYSDNYIDYERQNSKRKLEFYMDLLNKRLRPGSKVFELGAGLGLFLGKATRRYECSGCEPNEYGARISRERVGNVTVHHGSFECIPTDSSTQAVVAWDVLEHIVDLDRALETIHMRLSSRGFLVAVVPVYDSALGAITRLLDRDPTHVWKLSRYEWLDRLRGHGFEIVDYGGIVRRLIASRWYLHVTRPQFFLRRCSSALYFVAKKANAIA
jgi:SAM-dependent methyltransferase